MKTSYWLAVGIGGFVGSVLRFVLGGWFTRLIGAGAAWGTLLVNVIGCLVIGLVAGVLVTRDASTEARLFVMVGLLGGFTTYSSFALDTLVFLQEGLVARSVVYVVLQVVVGLLAAWLGFSLARTLA